MLSHNGLPRSLMTHEHCHGMFASHDYEIVPPPQLWQIYVVQSRCDNMVICLCSGRCFHMEAQIISKTWIMSGNARVWVMHSVSKEPAQGPKTLMLGSSDELASNQWYALHSVWMLWHKARAMNLCRKNWRWAWVIHSALIRCCDTTSELWSRIRLWAAFQFWMAL